MDGTPRQEGSRHLVRAGSGPGRRGRRSALPVAGDGDHQGTATGVRLALRSGSRSDQRSGAARALAERNKDDCATDVR
ncbi:hypothetical protein ACKI1I_06110 [Streptomyces turgidiscabies]|uniref:hypothetical protein n=1 Tax=Streptomyces turgidiscabies TaxID=85558 RepID=UPI00117FF724|nr:hypothetical protein [Streptomyces turgidiscabies]MDX3491394.1 hypothetical protein [Streptomyces turgidiscabies]